MPLRDRAVTFFVSASAAGLVISSIIDSPLSVAIAFVALIASLLISSWF